MAVLVSEALPMERNQILKRDWPTALGLLLVVLMSLLTDLKHGEPCLRLESTGCHWWTRVWELELARFARGL